METVDDNHRGTNMIAPLRYPVFRRIWLASVLSNFGQLVQGVGAAWAMTELTGNAGMVALVQSAAMLPLMLFALSAGAVADTYDRRIVALSGLVVSLAGATGLTLCAWFQFLTPWLILIFTFVIGSGIALFGPAWQASVTEQVPPAQVPEAIALNSISYNIARSFGPAIGGVIVAAAGVAAAFLVNALFFVPMIAVLLLWRRVHEPSRLPPERLMRAVVSGARYVFHSPSIRTIILRTIVLATSGCALSALMPLIAKDLLGGDAMTYGLMLGSFGIGAVLGALGVPRIRERLGPEAGVRYSMVGMAAAMLVVAFSHYLLVTGAALVVAGAAWMTSVTICNIGVQVVAPRWVSGRVLASFQTAVAGGISIGSWFWGHLANSIGVDMSLVAAGGAALITLLVGFLLRMPSVAGATEESDALLADPEVELAITSRSGPIVVEIEYRIPRHRARAFYGVMQEMERIRKRNGAYGWSLARDLADPELWTERYHCPTWLDYLRQRNRPTGAERELQKTINAFHGGSKPIRIRRMLERPLGSVRWREDVRDRAVQAVIPMAPAAGGP